MLRFVLRISCEKKRTGKMRGPARLVSFPDAGYVGNDLGKWWWATALLCM